MEHSAPASRRAFSSERAIEWIAAGLCVAALALWLARYSEFFHDDAYITLRYVARWLAGLGLGWNDGEFVEGFTHPLWLMQIAAVGALGVDLPVAARALGVGYLVALLGIWRVAGLSSLTALLVAAQPALALWAWGGLETVSFCFWLVAAILCVEISVRSVRFAGWAGLLFALAALSRPEGAGVGLLCAAALAAAQRSTAALRLVAALTLPLIAVELLRWGWFGDVLPNSARAKLGGISPTQTWQYGAVYLISSWAAWLPAALVALVVGLQDRSGSWRIEACACALLAAVVLSGGDHMPGGRFALPAGVVFALAAGVRLRGRPLRRTRWAVALVALAVAMQALGGSSLPRHLDPAARDGERVGRFLSEHLPAGSSVATATAGSTPYFAPKLRFIDTLGLNDREIAGRDPVPLVTRWQRVPGHRKGDGAYVLEREPDVVILGPAIGYAGVPADAWFLTDYELMRSAAFRTRYAPYRFAIADELDFVAFLRGGAPAVASLAARGERLTGSPPR